MGGALQPRGPAGGGAAAWRRSADPLRRCGAAAHSGRSPADPGTHAGRHRDVVVEHAATGLAPGRRGSADHQYLHDLAGAAPSGSELAEEPDSGAIPAWSCANANGAWSGSATLM